MLRWWARGGDPFFTHRSRARIDFVGHAMVGPFFQVSGSGQLFRRILFRPAGQRHREQSDGRRAKVVGFSNAIIVFC